MLYMIYLVLSYKYTEYKIFRHIQNLTEINDNLLKKISLAQEILENKNTRSYRNKILKSQQWLKNPGEKVVFLITEEKYKKYTREDNLSQNIGNFSQDLLDEKSLIQTMTVYQRWVYLIFHKDIR